MSRIRVAVAFVPATATRLPRRTPVCTAPPRPAARTPVCAAPPRPAAACRASARPEGAPTPSVRRVAVALALAHALVCGAPGALPPAVAATAADTEAAASAEGRQAVASVAGTEGMSEGELREQSRRNTRVSGKASQLFTKARRAAETGDFETALELYDRLVRDAPTFAPGYSNRANLLVARGRLREAVPDYDEALRLAPLDRDTWIVHVNRGCARAALGDDARAVLRDDFDRAYALRGDDPVLLSNRAGVYERLGKWDAALRDYQGALSGAEVKPFWLRYGLALFQRGRAGEAVSILKRVVTRFDVDDSRAALAIVLFDRGEVAAAETLWTGMERPRLFESRKFLDERLWPPRAVEAMDRFRALKE